MNNAQTPNWPSLETLPTRRPVSTDTAADEPQPNWDEQARIWAETRAKFPALFANLPAKPRQPGQWAYAGHAARDERHVAARETALHRPLSAPTQSAFQF